MRHSTLSISSFSLLLSYPQHVSRRFKNGFREGQVATRKVKSSSTEA